MTARDLYFPKICIGQTERQIIIRYKDKLDMQSQNENSDFFLSSDPRISKHRPHWLLGNTQNWRSWLLLLLQDLTERQADGDHKAICKYAHLCLSYDGLIQLNDFREIWYKCRSITDVTNFSTNIVASDDTKFILCFLLSVIQTWTWEFVTRGYYSTNIISRHVACIK
jgi:hypothetical protein